MTIKMLQKSLYRLWPTNAQNVIFSLRPYFRMAKLTTLLSLFLLDMFLYCFFSKFSWLLVCKTTFKGFHKISLQKRLCHGAWGILINGAPTQILNYFKDWTKFSICHSVKHNQQSRLTSLLHMYDVYETNCATFLMKRSFLTSVYKSEKYCMVHF